MSEYQPTPPTSRDPATSFVYGQTPAPGYGYAPRPGYGYAPQQPQGTNGLAITSLVTSVLGMGLVAVITGHIALGQIRRGRGAGRGLAIAGVIIGYVNVAAVVLLAVIAIPVYIGVQTNAHDAYVESDLGNAKIAVTAYLTSNPSASASGVLPPLDESLLGPYGMTMSPENRGMTITGSPSFFTIFARSSTGHMFQVTSTGSVEEVGG